MKKMNTLPSIGFALGMTFIIGLFTTVVNDNIPTFWEFITLVYILHYGTVKYDE